MDWASPPIPLKDENTRPLGVGGVVLDHDSGSEPVKHLTGKDTVLSHLVVPVRGDPNLPAMDEAEGANSMSTLAAYPSGEDSYDRGYPLELARTCQRLLEAVACEGLGTCDSVSAGVRTRV